MIVISKEHYNDVNEKINLILHKYSLNPKEFKWNKFNSMDKVNALKEFLEYLFKLMNDNLIYIHTLVWDIHDSRHEIIGRDDDKNLSVIYYKLIMKMKLDQMNTMIKHMNI